VWHQGRRLLPVATAHRWNRNGGCCETL